ncbi:cytochrome c3 family protein [Thermodesulfobacteriota bacterium]
MGKKTIYGRALTKRLTRRIRMYRVGLVVLGLLMIVAFGGILEVSGKDSSDEMMCVPMEVITLEPPESVESKKSTVDFPHSKHFVLDCKECHHTWSGVEHIQNCTTSGCHDLTKSPKKSNAGGPANESKFKYYKTAYHNLCIGCHKAAKTKNIQLEMSGKILKENLPKTGPTGCIKCHPK